MRVLNVKQNFSKQILFSYEREAIDRIPITRIMSMKGKKAIKAQNPYLVSYLKARYQIYKDSIYMVGITDKDGSFRNVYRINVDDYAERVRDWYKDHHYVDGRGQPSPWAAIRDYEDSARHADPDDDWFNYPDELKKKGKSHHPTTEHGRQMERERRAEYRRKKNLGK